jgi:hypothetical protein
VQAIASLLLYHDGGSAPPLRGDCAGKAPPLPAYTSEEAWKPTRMFPLTVDARFSVDGRYLRWHSTESATSTYTLSLLFESYKIVLVDGTILLAFLLEDKKGGII